MAGRESQFVCCPARGRLAVPRAVLSPPHATVSGVTLPHDAVKQAWEDKTLDLFMWFRREAGGPDYELVERRDGPDRIIRVVGTDAPIGVEITRCVVGVDAAVEQRIIAMAEALRGVLRRWARGGRVVLLMGTYPDTSREGVSRLVCALESAISAAGGLAPFVESLTAGRWRFENTVFEFSDVGAKEEWRLWNNHLSGSPTGSVDPHLLEQLLLERVADKRTKVPTYERLGRLILLVRNPYSAWRPSAAALAEAAAEIGPFVDEAWIVNHREGAIDLSPPEPRLVCFWGADAQRA